MAAAVPHAHTRIVPGVHHLWTSEQPGLFDGVLSTWIGGQVHPALRAVPAGEG